MHRADRSSLDHPTRGVDLSPAPARQMLDGEHRRFKPSMRYVGADGSIGWGLLHCRRSAAKTARSRPSTPSWWTSPTARSGRPGSSTTSRRAVAGTDPRRARRGPPRALRPADRRPARPASRPSTNCCCGCATPDGEIDPARRASSGRRAIRADRRDRPVGHPPGDRDRAAAGVAASRSTSRRARSAIPTCCRSSDAASRRPAPTRRLLVFEITETALMQTSTPASAFARGLRELGCGFALDDFGTGFGSFTYLKQLPVDLPQDRHRVRPRLPPARPTSRVVRAIVGLAREFGQRRSPRASRTRRR